MKFPAVLNYIPARDHSLWKQYPLNAAIFLKINKYNLEDFLLWLMRLVILGMCSTLSSCVRLSRVEAGLHPEQRGDLAGEFGWRRSAMRRPGRSRHGSRSWPMTKTARTERDVLFKSANKRVSRAVAYYGSTGAAGEIIADAMTGRRVVMFLKRLPNSLGGAP